MVVCVKLTFRLNLTWPLMVILWLTKSLMGFGGCFRRGRHERHRRQMGGKYIKWGGNYIMGKTKTKKKRRAGRGGVETKGASFVAFSCSWNHNARVSHNCGFPVMTENVETVPEETACSTVSQSTVACSRLATSTTQGHHKHVHVGNQSCSSLPRSLLYSLSRALCWNIGC